MNQAANELRFGVIFIIWYWVVSCICQSRRPTNENFCFINVSNITSTKNRLKIKECFFSFFADNISPIPFKILICAQNQMT